ncbi:4-amino-6-deoxy-N-Acetyl-D-hexosaminyl-(Lipid carrier) acetyltrasferase [Hyphomicrobium sulfonivorans]|uniref:4-amino-6-deoxy-N-Acetyl-D-hexosaminyl-(Lipid carrier) acetyltrasferase n=1 Tax=Hyphomicrobium sulfonivorans TaxID=121290 RepID=A0A109BLK0_HYPSL|nr:acetyltransferase [Hyphomicrobium sulfonivorans]KWT71021.1 4-amino-6-deoxy-N-Acetyl-D-hexosaminyl-(Lipid carrier) acetyltrasferase [Hyphomicrobium sulfonivorans]
MNRGLLILGAGGHGRVVADVALELGFRTIAFLDDAPQTPDVDMRIPVLGPLQLAETLLEEWPLACVAIGNNQRRQRLFTSLRSAGFAMPTLVHRSAVVSRFAGLGDGVVVTAGAVINAGASIGDACIINTGARIDHDCVIGEASHVAPGATLSGGVITGARAWLGTGCAVRQGVRIADDVLIGVGAAVVCDLTSAGTYIGVPARLAPEHRQ